MNKNTNNIEITTLVVICKLSDGTIRTINTDRKAKVEILNTLHSYYPEGITASDKPIVGVKIVLESGVETLAEYLKRC